MIVPGETSKFLAFPFAPTFISPARDVVNLVQRMRLLVVGGALLEHVNSDAKGGDAHKFHVAFPGSCQKLGRSQTRSHAWDACCNVMSEFVRNDPPGKAASGRRLKSCTRRYHVMPDIWAAF